MENEMKMYAVYFLFIYTFIIHLYFAQLLLHPKPARTQAYCKAGEVTSYTPSRKTPCNGVPVYALHRHW